MTYSETKKCLRRWAKEKDAHVLERMIRNEYHTYEEIQRMYDKGYARVSSKPTRRGWTLTVKGCKLLRNPQ